MNDILLYGEVGWENTSKGVVEQLAGMEGDVTLRVNSPGGDVYEGIGIMNALRGYQGGTVTAIVEGMAASAASFIAVGGADRIVARPNAELMIHDAWTFVDGNAEKLAKTLADLERMSENLASIYAERVGGDPAEWRDKMRAETWFSAQEALDAGLIDAVEDARQPAHAGVKQPVFAKALAQFKYAGRAAAPAPTIDAHSGQKGDAMSILNQLAQELGKEPEDVQRALSGFFNEAVAVTGEVEVTYPSDVKIVPTERITVDPIIGDKPAGDGEPVEVIEEGEEPKPDSAAVQLAKAAGLSFTMGDVAEGFDATVDEGGTVTIKAPSGVEPGDTAEFSVLVNDTTVPLVVTVRALSEDSEPEVEQPSDEVVETVGEDSGFNNSADVVMVPKSVWNEYLADRAKNAARIEAEQERELESKIDSHIRDGRYSASHRSEALAAYKHDPEAAEKTWGSLPKNKAVPVAEIGHSGAVDKMSKADELVAKARANRKNKENK